MRSLTGIKPSGLPHLGNYFGAIKPAVHISDPAVHGRIARVGRMAGAGVLDHAQAPRGRCTALGSFAEVHVLQIQKVLLGDMDSHLARRGSGARKLGEPAGVGREMNVR